MEMKERWQIEADIYLAEKQEQEDGVWAYGEVTVDQLMTFQVRVLTWHKREWGKIFFCDVSKKTAKWKVGRSGTSG